MPEVVSVELLAHVLRPTGGAWNAGEVAGFSPAEAASLIARGVARPVPVKAPARPPLDTMVKGAPVKK